MLVVCHTTTSKQRPARQEVDELELQWLNVAFSPGRAEQEDAEKYGSSYTQTHSAAQHAVLSTYETSLMRAWHTNRVWNKN